MKSKMTSDLIDSAYSKIGAIFFVLLIAIILTLLFASTYLFRAELTENEDRLVRTTANVLASSLERVSFSGRFHTQFYIDQLVQSENDIVSIHIINHQGEVLLRSTKPDFSIDEYFFDEKHTLGLDSGAIGSNGYRVRYRVTHEGKRFKQVLIPFSISFDRSQKGMVGLGISTNVFEEQSNQNSVVIFSVGFVLAVIAANFIFLFTRKVSKNMRELAFSFRGILDHAPMLVLLYDKKGRVLESGHDFFEIFLKDKGRTVNLNDLFSIDEIAQFPMLAPGISDESIFQEEMVFQRNGIFDHYASIHFSIALAVDKFVYCTMAININKEISMKNELRKHRDDLEHLVAARTRELERTNTELERFSYVASHDLQEPLRMVTSYMQLLERRYKDKFDGDALDFISFAVDGATRMKALIDDLLLYSRVGTQGTPFKEVDCQKVMDDVLANLKIAISESDAVITYDPLPKLIGEHIQLMQVFQNLIGNAIKFRGDRRPEINIKVVDQQDFWKFIIHDNGIGIEPTYYDQIFDIFKRLHGRDKYPGTGIGLAVCKRIVERHGGKIGVESHFGVGTIFYFTVKKQGVTL